MIISIGRLSCHQLTAGKLGISKKNCLILSDAFVKSQKRSYFMKFTPIHNFRNITENTLADTPSGYIQDPFNHPKRMVTYEKLTPEGQAAVDAIEREEDLFQREELAYSGYTTIAIQECKEIILSSKSTHHEIESACKRLQHSLEELTALIGTMVEKMLPTGLPHFSITENNVSHKFDNYTTISNDDCNHVRYIIALGMRRIGDFEKADSICMEILFLDHANCDALECLIELYTGTGQLEKLRRLLDKLSNWDSNGGLQQNKDSTKELAVKDARGNSCLVDMAMVLLSDILTEAASLHYIQNGEGSTSRFFFESITTITSNIGSQYSSLFIKTLFLCIDEQHIAARLESCTLNNSEQIMGVVISFLKMVLSRNLYELMDDAVRFEFQILSKLHSALRYTERRHESYQICERLIKLYREKSGKYDTLTQKRIRQVESGLLDDLESSYKLALFQFIEDRALDSLAVGKRLCVQAIEEFPQEASPWEVLSLILHKEDPVNGLSNAILAAKQAFLLDSNNLHILLLLANLYKADKRYKLYEAMMDRYRLLKYLIDNRASEKDMKATLKEIETLDEMNPREAEENDTQVLFDDMRKYIDQMEVAHTYSMPIDKEPRVFGEQPVSSPILDPSINTEKPVRPQEY